MTEPVPNLKGKQLGLKVTVAVAIVGAIAIGVAVIKFAAHDSDPGKDACEHMTDLVSNNASENDAWETRVRAAARKFEDQVVAMTVTSTEKVRIERDTADATCRELFRVYYNTSMYKHFEKLTGCIGKATSVAVASRCFEQMSL